MANVEIQNRNNKKEPYYDNTTIVQVVKVEMAIGTKEQKHNVQK